MLAARAKHLAIVTAIAAFVMLTNLGGPRLWDRDEPRNAGCAREMLQRSDWVVPTFNAELRTHKPVLLYWGIMLSYLAFGINEFAARFPSALAAVGSTICVYLMGRRLFGPRTGVWAGVALATNLSFVLAARAATPDSLLIFCTTLALTIFVCGTFRPRFETTPDDAPPQLNDSGEFFPRHWPTALAMYAVMGLGVLAKGPVGLVLPTAVIGMYLLIARLPRRNAAEGVTRGNAAEGVPYSAMRVLAPFAPLRFLQTCWTMHPLTAIFAVTAVAAPWYLAVGLATDGEFLKGFFVEHNLQRATGVMEGHRGSILYYPMAMLVGFFPWSVFAFPLAIDTVLQLRRRDRVHPGYLLAVCWVGVYVALFSLARTKLPSYIAPCFPALALLVGNYVDRWTRQAAAVAGGWLPAAFACLALAGVGVAIAIPLAAKRYLPGEDWLGLIGLTPLAGGAACIGLAASKNLRAAAGVFAATAVTFVCLVFSLGAQVVDRHQSSHVILQAIRANSEQPIVASYKILEPSWVFYGGYPIVELPAAQPETQQGVAVHFQRHPESFLITTSDRIPEIKSQFPADVEMLAETPLFLRDTKLVVYGRARAVPIQLGHNRHNPFAERGLR